MKNWLEMPALDEERSSICAPSVTNETMLDMVVNGRSRNTKECNTETVSTRDTDYCTGIEGYNTIALIKNDTGYYSGSSESFTQENGSYISEKAAFSKITKPKSTPVDYLIEEEELVQSAPSQDIIASAVPTGYVTLESEQLSSIPEIENNRHEDRLSKGTTSDQKFSFSNETKENNKSPALSEGDYFPYTTAEIQPASNGLTSPTVIKDNCENVNSPVISEGEYLPYTSAVNQHDPAAETTLLEKNHHLEQNCITGGYNAMSVKQETLITDSFPYITLDEDNPFSRNHASTDKMTTIDMNGCDSSYVTDVLPHSESRSDVFPPAMHTMHGNTRY